MRKRAFCAVFFGLVVTLGACSSSSDSSSTAGDGGGGGNGNGTGPDDQYAANRKLCVDTINQYRQTLGLPAYTEWNDEEACADGEAKSDSASGKAHGAFGTCNENAQDECPGWPGNDIAGSIKGCLQQMWNEGPGTDFSTHGHYINMSSTKYSQAACGFFVTADGSLWAVQNFK